MPSIDACRRRSIRAARFAKLGPTPASACVALFAVALIACGAPRAVAEPEPELPVATEGSSGSDAPRPSGPEYAVVEPGVVVRDGQLEEITFLEYVFGDVDPSEPLPLLVVLHGFGDQPQEPSGPYRGLPGAFRVVLPRGPVAVGGGFAWMSVRVGEHRLGELSEQLDVQTERIARFLVALREARAVRGPTILVGFSQGAILTLSVATRHPDLVGLALPLAGWLPPLLRVDAAEGAPRVLWMHGTADERIPFELAREGSDDLRARGFDVTLMPYEGAGHVMNDVMNADFHLWLAQVLQNLDEGRPLGDGLPFP